MADRVTIVGALSLLLLAGCTGGIGAPTTIDDGSPTATGTPMAPTNVDSYVFDHAGLGSPVIEGGITYDIENNTARSYVTTVTSREAATRRFNESVLDSGAQAFVANTSFAEAALVVYQSFPASSVPDYRVESVERDAHALTVQINRSSRYATDDITVETVLVRVSKPLPDRITVTTQSGHSVNASMGVVTITPVPTPNADPPVSLPFASEDPAENVEHALGIRLVNTGTDTIGYELSVQYIDSPACLEATPPCAIPTKLVDVLERSGKVPADRTETLSGLVRRKGNYTVRVTASLPDDVDSRTVVNASTTWTIDEGASDLVVRITGATLTIEADPSKADP